MLTYCRGPCLSPSGGEDRLLRLHVQQVHPGSPRLSAGQDCEWINWVPAPRPSSLTLADDAHLISSPTSSLARRCPSTPSVTSRRCWATCWTRSSKPSLSADCVRWPSVTFALALPPPAPLFHLAETRHNHVTTKKEENTAAGTFQYRTIY